MSMENESRGLYGRYLPLLLTLGDFVLLNLVGETEKELTGTADLPYG